MTNELKITAITLAVTALIGGVGVVCSDVYESLKERLKNERAEKEIAIDHVHRFDSLFTISQAHNADLEKKITELNDRVILSIEHNKALTNEALIVLNDSLFSRIELDSIKNTLIK